MEQKWKEMLIRSPSAAAKISFDFVFTSIQQIYWIRRLTLRAQPDYPSEDSRVSGFFEI